MNDELLQLTKLYRDSAIAHGEFMLAGNHREANKLHDKIINTMKQIRLHEADGDAVLLELVTDKNPSVACWAATHSLRKFEAVAKDVLEKISQNRGPIGFTAKMTVQEWNKGRLNQI